MVNPSPIVRFAPSPTGFLHVGDVRATLFHPPRLALTARETGPEMAKLLPLIGRAKVAARLTGTSA
jgi:glutamyl/glutaminyl-tRNA synthetase